MAIQPFAKIYEHQKVRILSHTTLSREYRCASQILSLKPGPLGSLEVLSLSILSRRAGREGLSPKYVYMWLLSHGVTPTKTHKVLEKTTSAETLLVWTKKDKEYKMEEGCQTLRSPPAGSRQHSVTNICCLPRKRMMTRGEAKDQGAEPSLLGLQVPPYCSPPWLFPLGLATACLTGFPVPVRAFLIQSPVIFIALLRFPPCAILLVQSLPKSHPLPTLKSFWECLIIKAIPWFNFAIFS